MFNKETENDRGQVGIGTLIVFIALVLVAAIAAGVLINTAGFLQSQAEATGQESTDQVANGIQIDGAQVSADGDFDDPQITVSLAPGSDSVDLDAVQIEAFGDTSASVSPEQDITGLIREDDSSLESDETVLRDDDFAVLELAAESGVEGFDLDLDLSEGDEVELVITTADGSQTTTVLNVPDPVDESQESVSL